MDVLINSQIQSPLVRTLARTKGKSQSFTHNIPDNVPPCSMSKIVLQTQSSGNTTYGSTYKIKIPQYGFLRDIALRYTLQEAPLPSASITFAQQLYQQHVVCIDDICVQNITGASGWVPTTAPYVGFIAGGSSPGQAALSWYSLQNANAINYDGLASASQKSTANTTLGSEAMTVASAVTKLDQNLSALRILAPQFSKLYGQGTITEASAECILAMRSLGTYQENGFFPVVSSAAPGAPSLVTVAAGSLNYQSVTATDISPLSAFAFINGDVNLWSNMLTLYYNIYNLSQYGTSTAAKNICTLIWNALIAQPRPTVSLQVGTCNAWLQTVTQATLSTVGYPNGFPQNAFSVAQLNNYSAGVEPTFDSASTATVDVTLAPYMEAVSRAGRVCIVPKLPQFTFDNTGTISGVEFVSMHLMHPLDNASTFANTFLGQIAAGTMAYRQFGFNDYVPPGQTIATDNDWAPWDWQTESFYYPGFGALIADSVVLSSHNRPIQTVYPVENYMRTARMGEADKFRYGRMQLPKITQQGKPSVQGLKQIYSPLLLASTENPSLNFDTRFVEQLDLDIYTQQYANLYYPADQGPSGTLSVPTTLSNFVAVSYVYNLFAATATGGSTLSVAPASWISTTFYSDLSLTGVASTSSALAASATSATSYQYWLQNSVRQLCLNLRSQGAVAANAITVEAIAYFHNFHDATAQAIRDANYKPGEPANILQYNTYRESALPLKSVNLVSTMANTFQIMCNNLVQGITFVVRRTQINPAVSRAKRDHFMKTLPLKAITLTGSGQQLYAAINDENSMMDVWDYDLASGKQGRKYNNGVLIQSRQDFLTGETFYFYYIPFSFSSDMTYNSGSVAFQTINNPVLSITVDVGSNATVPGGITVNDNDYTLFVYENYWNLLRIDSNTGAITRSLDL